MFRTIYIFKLLFHFETVVQYTGSFYSISMYLMYVQQSLFLFHFLRWPQFAKIMFVGKDEG